MNLSTPQQLAEAIGVSKSVILTWHREGRIPAEVCEGRVIRFDAERVKATLAKRAAKQAKEAPVRVVVAI